MYQAGSEQAYLHQLAAGSKVAEPLVAQPPILDSIAFDKAMEGAAVARAEGDSIVTGAVFERGSMTPKEFNAIRQSMGQPDLNATWVRHSLNPDNSPEIQQIKKEVSQTPGTTLQWGQTEYHGMKTLQAGPVQDVRKPSSGNAADVWLGKGEPPPAAPEVMELPETVITGTKGPAVTPQWTKDAAEKNAAALVERERERDLEIKEKESENENLREENKKLEDDKPESKPTDKEKMANPVHNPETEKPGPNDDGYGAEHNGGDYTGTSDASSEE
jgi:hypothetical protein